MQIRRVSYYGLDINTVAAAVRAAVWTCRWTLASEIPGMIVVRVPFSLYSYGERMEIRFYQDCFDVSSACIFPLQLIDWGKNSRNIQDFLTAYQRCLQQPCGGPMVC